MHLWRVNHGSFRRFNAVSRADFVLLFDSICKCGGKCDNIAQHCSRIVCKRCGGQGTNSVQEMRRLQKWDTTLRDSMANMGATLQARTRAQPAPVATSSVAELDKSAALSCPAKPQHPVCDGKCLRSSQNCRLELALLSVVECPVIAVHANDDIERTVELAKQVFNHRGAARKQDPTQNSRLRTRSSACHTERENFNDRLAQALSNAKISHQDLDLATVLHQAYFEKRSAIIDEEERLPDRRSTAGDAIRFASRSRPKLSRGSSSKGGTASAAKSRQHLGAGSKGSTASAAGTSTSSGMDLQANPMHTM